MSKFSIFLIIYICSIAFINYKDPLVRLETMVKFDSLIQIILMEEVKEESKSNANRKYRRLTA